MVRRTTRVVVVVLAVAVAAAAGLLAGSAIAQPDQVVPDQASVDAGFARDMSAHHAQAVRMSMLVLEDTTDPQVRTLASDILLTQQQQIGQMYGWLELWGLPQRSPTPPMGWLAGADGAGHGSMGAMRSSDGSGDAGMPGMASPEDLQRLDSLSGPEADRLYLQLMVPHHRGGVQMAEAARSGAATSQVRGLAEKVVTSQTAEIAVLESMLADRGGPLP